MSAIQLLHPDFHHLLTECKTQRRNKQAQQIQIQHENELIQFLAKSKWQFLVSSGKPLFLMDKNEVKNITDQLYVDSSSLLTLYNKNQLLMDIIKFGNNSLGWSVSIPNPVYLLSRQLPLLNEYDFIELAAFRVLETKFYSSIEMLKALSIEERIGQILFSAITNGALLVAWKQKALMKAKPTQWVVESFATWVELKGLKPAAQKKPAEELCDNDYNVTRWFPDPVSESLILRWFEDFQDEECFLESGRHIQTLLFIFLRRIGISKNEMPKSIAEFVRWASHSIALEIPPYMCNISVDIPQATHISSESWLRMYSGKRVIKYDSSIPKKENGTSLDYSTPCCRTLVPLSIQDKYLERVGNNLADPKGNRKTIISDLKSQLKNQLNDPPSFISWLVASFILEILQHGGQSKETLTLSTIKRYLSAINSPLLNAFSDVDASTLDENSWLSHLQNAIDHSNDQMTRNRIATFADFIQHFDAVSDFDINDLEGVSISKRVNANLVSQKEFDCAISEIKFGGRLERMQRLAGVLGYYLGLRSGETIHILLKDIAGSASPELLIRSNRYYGTKNRTSRRLPLVALLPAPQFHEFMLFYEERLQEEANKLGNKLLFCYKENSTSPLTYKELVRPIVDKLILVTGDQTLTYHGLRHSFANNTLLRLLIPEFPRLRCLEVDMFQHEHFSMKSCVQFRQRLLPGAEKDVRTSVRDVLYQLAMFMGHASPETTVKSYLHMFDWIIHRCLTGDTIELSDNQIRSLLKEDGQYWSELKKGFTSFEKKGPLNADKVLRYFRKKHIDAFKNCAKEKVIKRNRSYKIALFRELVPSDLIQLLPMLFKNAYTIEEISNRLNVSPDDIIQIKESAEWFSKIKTRLGRSRMPLLLPPLRGRQEHKDLNRILSQFTRIRSNDAHVQFGLQKFIYGAPSTGMEVKLGKASEVNMYIKLLCKLGIPKTRIILWYYPDSNATESERKEMCQWWAKFTSIPTDRILQKPSQRDQLSQDKRRQIGWISVFVRKDKASKEKSTGVQQALHLLAVFKGIPVL